MFPPQTQKSIQKGINALANVIQPTLGPLPRLVAIQPVGEHGAPDFFDNGGDIARLVIELPDGDADMGAMLLRDTLWRMQREVGDGTATAAVLYRQIYNDGLSYIASGGSAMRLKRFLEDGSHAILLQLNANVIRLQERAPLARVAHSICHDAMVARYLGEIFEIVGEYGRVEIRAGRNQQVEREYVEGMYWDKGLWSQEMFTDPITRRAELENVGIVISDLAIDDPRQLTSVLARAMLAKLQAVVIVVDQLSESGIGLLMANNKPDEFRVIAVRTPGWGAEEQSAAMDDLARLTGGRAFHRQAGDTFERIQIEDFGQARRAWADWNMFGIVGGKGDPKRLRQHLKTLRAAFEQTDEPTPRTKLLERIGKLQGGAATLWVGDATEQAIQRRVQLAERTADALRGALMEGVLPGGGVALLNCIPLLEQNEWATEDPDERAAYHILARALQEPLRIILHNAGYEPSAFLPQLQRGGGNCGLDVTTGQVIDVVEAGILDVAAVQKSAVYSAIHGAAMALTLDVLVHHRKHEPPPGVVPTLPKKKL
ncbi:MAG TPA: TCP-1/cpn60 chaperonin family protein [Anaerolineae bacterium]|nr:TCP-1/cpn60 chaperonin family protein [Anaerolineae bacterium]